MRFVSFELVNFKSFRNSGKLRFEPGFNLLYGQNNSGKSSLLEALRLQFEANPHRSPSTKPRETTVPTPTSSAKFAIVVEQPDIADSLMSFNSQFYIPISDSTGSIDKHGRALLAQLLEEKSITLELSRFRTNDQGQISEMLSPSRVPSHSLYKAFEPFRNAMFSFQRSRREYIFHGENSGDPLGSEVGAVIGRAFRDKIYSFNAERFSMGECPFGESAVLDNNARNLPEVLNVMQGVTSRYAEFNRLVREIFPSIQWVSVRPKKGQSQTLEIVVWIYDPKDEREDLTIGLRDCGTGVGQVLAMLYVALSSKQPRVVLIDEPNSFLHPGAAKKLIEILGGFSHLQYIVATHSPDLLRSANPSTVKVVTWTLDGSRVESCDTASVESQQTLLAEVGATLSDVFGADYVLWVEGSTEKESFPIVLKKLLKRPLLGLQIAPIRDIGTLATRRGSARLAFDVYRRLTEGTALVPKAIAFSFDQEGRDTHEQERLVKESKGLIHFLPRRMYENFLLDPHAIAAALTNNGIECSANIVTGWLEKNGGSDLYFQRGQGIQYGSSGWHQKVDGARLLSDVFTSLSQSRLEYRKVEHGVQLTEWLIANEPEALRELATYIETLLPK